MKKSIEIHWDMDTVRQQAQKAVQPLSDAVRPVEEKLEEKKWFQHLKTVCHHRELVRQHCFRVGLYRQGLMHDLSKFSPVEFLVGAKYYRGFESPNNAERRDRGYSSAWLHHKGRNKHHLEYWIDYSLGEETPMAGMKMPKKYVVEMFCDRVAASKTYRGEQYKDSDPWEYYQKSKSHYMMNPETRDLLEDMLKRLADEGEDATFNYIKREILQR